MYLGSEQLLHVVAHEAPVDGSLGGEEGLELSHHRKEVLGGKRRRRGVRGVDRGKGNPFPLWHEKNLET